MKKTIIWFLLFLLIIPGLVQAQKLTEDPRVASAINLLEMWVQAQLDFERIAGITSNVSTTRHWTGAFAVPVDSDRITARFGLRRSYNGGPYSSFHGGVDYGGPSTTPIAATAAGEVVFAERLQIRGNATIIDHGWGVFSGYWHQSEIIVEQGDFVVAGQQIGLIGSTGLSTGNHLHWEIWVGANQVNPLAWLGLELP